MLLLQRLPCNLYRKYNRYTRSFCILLGDFFEITGYSMGIHTFYVCLCTSKGSNLAGIALEDRDLQFIKQTLCTLCPETGCTGSNGIKNNRDLPIVCHASRKQHGFYLTFIEGTYIEDKG